eukprot:SAG11_NODE_121_length_15851_cov_6.082466_7_plen_54_part_00
MFVNVVLQAFEDLTNAAGLPVTLADMGTFADVWAHYVSDLLSVTLAFQSRCPH